MAIRKRASSSRTVVATPTPGGRASIPSQMVSTGDGMPSAVNARVSGLLPGNSGGKASVKSSKSVGQTEKPALRK